MKLLFSVLLMVAASGAAQTVNGQASSGGQTATFSVQIKKVPKLTATVACAGPVDAQGAYSVVAGGTTTCTLTLNLPAPTGGATATLTSSDTSQVTVPSTIAILAGATTATFLATATP